MCVEKRGEVKMSIVEVRGLCKAFGDNQVLKNYGVELKNIYFVKKYLGDNDG